MSPNFVWAARASSHDRAITLPGSLAVQDDGDCWFSINEEFDVLKPQPWHFDAYTSLSAGPAALRMTPDGHVVQAIQLSLTNVVASNGSLRDMEVGSDGELLISGSFSGQAQIGKFVLRATDPPGGFADFFARIDFDGSVAWALAIPGLGAKFKIDESANCYITSNGGGTLGGGVC